MRAVTIVALGLVLLVLPTCARGRGLSSATTPRPRRARWWFSQHRQINDHLRRDKKVDVIFLGDSITSGWRRIGADPWRRYYGARHAVNMGIGGDETGHLLWRWKRAPLKRFKRHPPKVVVLLVGVNNAFHRPQTAQTIAAGISAIVRRVQERLPKTQILLLGIFPTGSKTSRIRKKVAAINQRIAHLAAADRVIYLDIGARFLDRHGEISKDVLFDYLHPTARGYRIWAEAMEPTLRTLLGDRETPAHPTHP